MTGMKAAVLPLLQPKETPESEFLRSIVREHGQALRLFLRVRVKHEQDREDIYQEVFLNLYKMPDLIERLSQQPESLRSYLFSVATNRIRDRLRQDRSRMRNSHDCFDEEVHGPQGSAPEDFLILSQRCEDIRKALLTINPKHRKAFILSRIELLSYQEISEQLDVSVSTVEKYISNALYALRKDQP